MPCYVLLMLCWGEAMMICVLAPTAVAATVVMGMLGGSVPCLAAYTLASNLCVAIVSPVIFSLVGTQEEMSFGAFLWSFCLTIVVGKTVSFIMQQDSKNYGEEFLIAFRTCRLCPVAESNQ